MRGSISVPWKSQAPQKCRLRRGGEASRVWQIGARILIMQENMSQRRGREPDLRCGHLHGLLCGQTGLMQARLLLTRHSFARAARSSLCRS